MNRIVLLDKLKEHTKESIADLIMPTRQQSDSEKGSRPADVHLMRLPDSTAAQRKHPISSIR